MKPSYNMNVTRIFEGHFGHTALWIYRVFTHTHTHTQSKKDISF